MANWLNEEVYTYDMYGNQTAVEVYEINEEVTSSEKAGDVRYTYDESNQMVQYETKGVEETEWTQAARNVYNGEGMRIRQYENGNDWARQYFYIGGALAISTDGSNENFVKSENILDPSGTIIAARREAKDGEQIEGSAYWVYHYDAQGSATNLVGVKDGALYRAEENVYDAFGNEETGMKEPVSSVQNDIKFTGATLDNSGTYYLGSRHYDPNTGRFLQQDTFKGDIYSPWTQNLHTYTSNNPVNYVDPTGHFFEEIAEMIVDAFSSFLGGVFAEVGSQWLLAGTTKDARLGTNDITVEEVNSHRTRKTSKNRGKSYKSREQAMNVMNLMLEMEGAKTGYEQEFGAFVYQVGEDWYISNLLPATNKVLNSDVSEEMENLGLIGLDIRVDFAHIHTLRDSRNLSTSFIVDEKGTELSAEQAKAISIKTEIGSKEDWKILKDKRMGNIKLSSFTTIAPPLTSENAKEVQSLGATQRLIKYTMRVERVDLF